MTFIYHTFFFDPLYNGLTLSFNLLPWADAGVIVILFTTLVRLVLFPLSRKAVITQFRMNEIAPELEKLKEKYKNNPEAQARETLNLYRDKKINPFSGIIVLIIQLPLIFALYRVFLHISEARTDILYSFVHAPLEINTMFLGLIDISGKSMVLAALAAISTYFQFKLASFSQVKPASKGKDSFGDTLTRSMQTQMKYVFPVVVFFISYNISAAIALYWVTTNIFTIGQEIAVRKKRA